MTPHLTTLTDPQRQHYRDLLRAARYAALADAEGFNQICFALEALGKHLNKKGIGLSDYERSIKSIACGSPVFNPLPKNYPYFFKHFDALYRIVREARNDNMHGGAYARHATTAGIELCIGLEDALMSRVEKRTVGKLMVKSPITVEDWQPVAHARQLMLMHSFSLLPVFTEYSHSKQEWHLLSELALAKFLRTERNNNLGMSIKDAMKRPAPNNLELVEARTVRVNDSINDLLNCISTAETNRPTLWLVVDERHRAHLAGVLSPFELM